MSYPGFGMGTTMTSLKQVGKYESLNIALMMYWMVTMAFRGKFFRTRLGIWSGPGALLFGRVLMTLRISSGFVKDLLNCSFGAWV